jgi:hypothetical protein
VLDTTNGVSTGDCDLTLAESLLPTGFGNVLGAERDVTLCDDDVAVEENDLRAEDVPVLDDRSDVPAGERIVSTGERHVTGTMCDLTSIDDDVPGRFRDLAVGGDDVTG